METLFIDPNNLENEMRKVIVLDGSKKEIVDNKIISDEEKHPEIYGPDLKVISPRKTEHPEYPFGFNSAYLPLSEN
ncbi:hypothetical protein COV24_03760 [candidate division WWE3 bacterium CG10_big_fil_rev_8_21_14_0_10_32_10]|uniref:Uncharacterized protein n=1 Tax=candidate division WWE3 bacterium CG10_big_fil_rev_8_21_14_0_10_32_10 TaxID=1975090 RepID=A0A2H0R9T6_UNCKA|nr:MAG: hypothetical protein COV24_03760 [candidate division WWE3 bacterium CG10_big_fil_rev_8_21_14_0_10_32_10]